MPRYPVAVALAAVLLGGCMSDNVGPRQGIGALTGAVGGAFLGEKVGGTRTRPGDRGRDDCRRGCRLRHRPKPGPRERLLRRAQAGCA